MSWKWPTFGHAWIVSSFITCCMKLVCSYFRAFQLLRNDACRRVQGHSNTALTCGKLKCICIYSIWDAVRETERALTLSGKCRVFFWCCYRQTWRTELPDPGSHLRLSVAVVETDTSWHNISSGTQLCFTSMHKRTVRITGADLQKKSTCINRTITGPNIRRVRGFAKSGY